MCSSLPSSSRSKPTIQILKKQGWVPLSWLYKAEIVKKDLATYQLVELQLWKDSFNLRHEVLLGEFRNCSEVVYIATERFARKAMRPTQLITSVLRSLLRTGTLDTYEPQTVLADDAFWVMPDVKDFRDAIDYIVKSDNRTDSKYVMRATVKYNLDSESGIGASSKSKHPPTPHPNIMDFIYAVYAANSTRPYYTPTGSNCFWFARAIMHIFSQKFAPSEKSKAPRRSFLFFGVTIGRLPKQDLRNLLDRFELCIAGTAQDCRAPEDGIEAPAAKRREREAKQKEFETKHMLYETRRMEFEARIRLYEAQLQESEVRAKLAVVQRMKIEIRLEALRAGIESRSEASGEGLRANLAAERVMQGALEDKFGIWGDGRARLEWRTSTLEEILAVGRPLRISI